MLAELAVTVIVLEPDDRGMLAMLHDVPVTTATPDKPDVEVHTTVADALPVTDPVNPMLDAVVLDGGTFTVSARESVGVPSCAA